MNDFVFENSTRFYFGTQSMSHILSEVGNAKVVMVAYGGGSIKRTGIYERVTVPLLEAGKKVVDFSGIMANPTWTKVMEGVELARKANVDYIIAVGGGSVMDCSKMIAVCAADTGTPSELWDKYFVRFAPIDVAPIPLGIVVTATGTGSEGNGGAVITNEKTHVKTGADRPAANARFAILDPTLTYSVPRGQKASGGYDILNHMMEEYFSRPVGNVLTDDLLEAAMRSVIRNLPIVLENPNDYQSHANIEWASSLAENRVLKSGKQTCFQCHVIEHAIGAYTDCVHGLGLAAITTNYYRHIFDASEEALFQFNRFATNVWGISAEGKDERQVALEGIEALEAWTRQIGVARTLTELGVTEEMIPRIASKISALPTGLAKLNATDIRDILHESM